jgi:hypothetical protein
VGVGEREEVTSGDATGGIAEEDHEVSDGDDPIEDLANESGGESAASY